MKRNITWPIAGVVALAIVVYGITAVNAQRDPPRDGFMRAPIQPGRFAVAHAGPERIVILDTATGQLYVGGEKDFKKMSELPRFGEMGRPAIRRGDGEDRPRENERERPKEGGDRVRPKEREKPKEGEERPK